MYPPALHDKGRGDLPGTKHDGFAKKVPKKVIASVAKQSLAT